MGHFPTRSAKKCARRRGDVIAGGTSMQAIRQPAYELGHFLGLADVCDSRHAIYSLICVLESRGL